MPCGPHYFRSFLDPYGGRIARAQLWDTGFIRFWARRQSYGAVRGRTGPSRDRMNMEPEWGSSRAPYGLSRVPYGLQKSGPRTGLRNPYGPGTGSHDWLRSLCLWVFHSPFGNRKGPHGTRIGRYGSHMCTLRNPQGTLTGSWDREAKNT